MDKLQEKNTEKSKAGQQAQQLKSGQTHQSSQKPASDTPSKDAKKSAGNK